MADHYHPATQPIARKQHRCCACHARIEAGEKHFHQTGYYDGSAFRNRYHVECWNALADDGCDEFTPGELDPPERLRQHPTQSGDTPHG